MKKESQRTLVFAAHPDDEVLGAGGIIAKKAKAGESVVVCVATKCKMFSKRKEECEASNSFLGVEETCFLEFPDLGLDTVPHRDVTEAIVEVIQKYKPDNIFTHHPGDLHTDHKALTAAVMVALRPKYEHVPRYAYTYETLSETGWDFQNPVNHFSPNVYIDISDEIDSKMSAMQMYGSQLQTCRDANAIRALAMFRGSQAGMGYAEAFSLIRGYEP